jgi:hypothetical protein
MPYDGPAPAGRAFKNCPVGNFSEGVGLRVGAKHAVSRRSEDGSPVFANR